MANKILLKSLVLYIQAVNCGEKEKKVSWKFSVFFCPNKKYLIKSALANDRNAKFPQDMHSVLKCAVFFSLTHFFSFYIALGWSFVALHCFFITSFCNLPLAQSRTSKSSLFLNWFGFLLFFFFSSILMKIAVGANKSRLIINKCKNKNKNKTKKNECRK